MAAGEAVPFRKSPDGWSLNYSNPIVIATMASDEHDLEAVGEVGTIDGGAAEYALIWRIVGEAHVPLSDIGEEWTFDRMACFGAYLRMKYDYRSVWTEYYRNHCEKKKENKKGL